MLLEQTHDKLIAMKLFGMAAAFSKNSARHGRFSVAVRSHSEASDMRRRSMGLGTS